eukprot:scaffold13569_cov87-Isochrysis_galbana.AAC.2
MAGRAGCAADSGGGGIGEGRGPEVKCTRALHCREGEIHHTHRDGSRVVAASSGAEGWGGR